jgi:hypothetical protein
MKHLILLIFIAMFVSCENNETTDNDSDTADERIDNDENSCVEDIYGLGGESCPFQEKSDFVKRKIETSRASIEGLSFTIDELLFLEEGNEAIPRGDCGQEKKCGITFKNYDKDLFKDSLIGKEIVLYWQEGFYGTVNNEVMRRGVYVSRHKDGTLISVAAIGIADEESDREGDVSVWPSELIPEIQVDQKVLSSCEEVCYQINEDTGGFPLDVPYYDYLIFPPLEFKVEGKDPVVVRNGEVIRSEGYEYFVRESKRVHQDDPDQIIFDLGKKYRFDFFILNTEALR